MSPDTAIREMTRMARAAGWWKGRAEGLEWHLRDVHLAVEPAACHPRLPIRFSARIFAAIDAARAALVGRPPEDISS